jgi:hypothetical protein
VIPAWTRVVDLGSHVVRMVRFAIKATLSLGSARARALQANATAREVSANSLPFAPRTLTR